MNRPGEGTCRASPAECSWEPMLGRAVAYWQRWSRAKGQPEVRRSGSNKRRRLPAEGLAATGVNDDILCSDGEDETTGNVVRALGGDGTALKETKVAM
jgi:hypothetical protein